MQVIQKPPAAEQKAVELVGYHDLNGKPAFKIAMQRVGNRYLLYLAHLWHRGWSVLDVTDPANPKYENYIPGPADTWTIQVQVADGKMITALEQPRPGWGVPDGRPFEEGAYIWDVKSDPIHPKLLAHYKTGGTGTHRNFYAGGKYLFMSSHVKGFLGRILVVLDISDADNPKEVSRWWWPGQNVEAGEKPEFPSVIPRYFHGPAYVVGNTAYLSYGRIGVIVLDISDISSPKLIRRFSFGDLGAILTGSVGCHSAVPIPDRNLLVVTSEAIESADGVNDYNYVFTLDVKDPALPRVINQFPQPVLSRNDLQYKNYAEKGAVFGPHNLHHWQGQECLFNPRNTMFLTYCNAGLRVFDLSDPYVPREEGYYVATDPKTRIGTKPTRGLVTYFDDVLVDSRGYVYCSEKNSGLYILKYNGKMS